MATLANPLLLDHERPPRARLAAESLEDQVVRIIRACKREAREARLGRIEQNERNLDAYFSRQDWSHKQKGQSAEFLPKVSEAVEQFSAFVKRAMTDFGDWGSIDYYGALPPGLEAADLWRLLRSQLDSLGHDVDEKLNFATLMADALKVGALESLIVLKVHGTLRDTMRYTVERGMQWIETPMGQVLQPQEQLVQKTIPTWHLAIDLIQPGDWFPDPTGRHLYQIHTVERDLYQVAELSEGPGAIYDPDVVAEIEADFARQLDQKRREIDRGQDDTTAPGFRRRVVLDEFWGTLLDDHGRVMEKNCLATVANDKYLIRVPEANPSWHGQSPFVACPLVRVPFSIWHKALMDNATLLNLTQNELFNLIVDGGIAAVWGTRQIKMDWLEDPKQVEAGIPQGVTLKIKTEVPAGAKVLETVTTGTVPQESLTLYGLVNEEFNASALTNDLKMGQLPPTSTKATAMVESQQGQAGLIDGIVRDVEDNLIEVTLRKAFLEMLQHVEDLWAPEVVDILGERAAMQLGAMSPAQRYATFAQGCRFTVNGLSAVLARARDFQKLVLLMETIKGNPFLMQAYAQRISSNKVLSRLFKSVNVDPEGIEADPEEQFQAQQQMQQLQLGAGGGASGGSELAPPVTVPGTPPAVAQATGTEMAQLGQEPGGNMYG